MEGYKYCESCGTQMPADAVVCPNCGKQQKVDNKKFCKHCGDLIDKDCVVCPKCGKQVEQLRQEQPNIVINNTNTNTNTANATAVASRTGRVKNKWVAFFLCLFFGVFGAHKFYEGKVVMGVLYLFTLGLFCIGWLVDAIVLLFKPNPYYV